VFSFIPKAGKPKKKGEMKTMARITVKGEIVNTKTSEAGPGVVVAEETKSDEGGANTNEQLPKTKQEWAAAMRKLVAIIEVDYGLGTEGRWLGFAYGTGLLRVKFPSGNTIAAQAPDAETAIKSMREIAKEVGRMAEKEFDFCGVPHIEVHRVPTNCMGKDGLNKNVCGWLTSVGLEVHAKRAA
jgi:hypothetical protein